MWYRCELAAALHSSTSLCLLSLPSPLFPLYLTETFKGAQLQHFFFDDLVYCDAFKSMA